IEVCGLPKTIQCIKTILFDYVLRSSDVKAQFILGNKGSKKSLGMSFITSASQHRPAVPSGASCRPLSFSNNITGHSARAPAGSEIIMAVKQSRFQRLRVPASRFPGHRLRLHLRSSQPWPTFPASFAEYSFCSVQVVAGGGG
ncbi:hypothetical protein KUCAC02_028598, partial [Chaenocephalus aceratus]